MRYPGTIKARFLPAIPAGLDREEFMRRLIAETEAACDALLVETAALADHPPLPPTAAERLPSELEAEREDEARLDHERVQSAPPWSSSPRS